MSYTHTLKADGFSAPQTGHISHRIVQTEIGAGYHEWVSAGGLTNPYEQPVPASVTRRQFRQALVRSRIRAAFEAAAAADQDTKDWYFESTSFERADPELATVATAIGKSDLEVDTLFKLAGAL